MAASIACKHFRIFHRNKHLYLVKPIQVHFSTLGTERIQDEEVSYPPVKPRYPPGNWGNMPEKAAWKRHDAMEKINKLETVKDRIQALTEKDIKYLKLPKYFRKPKLFEYQTFITKTHTIEGLPEIYKKMSVDSDLLKQTRALIENVLLLEYEMLHRDKQFRQYKLSDKQMYRDKTFVKNMLNRLIPTLFKHNPSLITARVDEDIQVKAFWGRRYLLEDGGGQWDKDIDILKQDWIQAEYMNDYQIRTEFPLPEFVPFSDALCQNEEFPSLQHFSKVYGLPTQGWETKRELSPGFNCGDPCEFGLVNFKNATVSHSDQQKFSDELIEGMKLGLGITNSFTWLLAQAYYQGFHHLCDITYPLTTQTVLTDGKAFSFFSYQLNTIELSKLNDANPYQNICWYQKEENLYNSVEDGKVIGFNEDVCEMILKVLLMKTKNRGINMKPTLPLSYIEMIEVEPEHIGREGLPRTEEEMEEEVEEETVRQHGDFDV